MSTRISSAAGVLALAACGGAVQPQAAEGAQRIECAAGAGEPLARDCLVEREARDGLTLLVVRRSDGGYRRFVQLEDGRGLAAADGADEARVSLDGELLQVEIADETYRFPARSIGADDQPQ